MGGWVRSFSDWPPVIQQIISHDNGGYDRSLGIDWRGGGTGWSAFCGEGGVLGAVPNIVSQWTFVAVVYDQNAQTVRLQVDDMVLTKTGVTLGSGENQLFIDANPIFSEIFEGAVDNVFVFGDALTDHQLAYIRHGGSQAILTAKSKSVAAIIELLLGNGGINIE